MSYIVNNTQDTEERGVHDVQSQVVQAESSIKKSILYCLSNTITSLRYSHLLHIPFNDDV